MFKETHRGTDVIMEESGENKEGKFATVRGGNFGKAEIPNKRRTESTDLDSVS
jgi:hypothetical protein